MAGVTRIPRSRGGVSGVLLILLGAWGGLVPFIGPYFSFAYTPDKAWAYTSGRLWLSVVPGAAALLGGVLVTIASHRAIGCVGAFVAALGGAWFIVGTTVIGLLGKSGSINTGAPLTGTLGPLSFTNHVLLEGLGFFTGTGALILFFGALALGRFSVVGVKDAALAEELLAGVPTDAYPDEAGQTPEEPSYPSGTDVFSAPGSQYASDQTQTSAEQYPTTTGPLGRTPPPETGPLRGPS